MPRQVKGPDGIVHLFPDDATDAEVAAALESSTPYQGRDVLAEGRKSAGIKSDVPPSAVAQWFENHLRPALETIAHPQTISDIAALLVPDANLSGTVRAGQAAAKDIASIPVRKPIAGALDAASAALDNPVAGAVSPRAPHLGKLVGAAADVVRGKPDVVLPVGRLAGKAPTLTEALTQAVNEARQAPPEANVPARLPEYPQAATDTMRAMQERQAAQQATAAARSAAVPTPPPTPVAAVPTPSAVAPPMAATIEQQNHLPAFAQGRADLSRRRIAGDDDGREEALPRRAHHL